MKRHFTFLFIRITLVALIAALLASAMQVTPVHAASIVVNSNADTDANDGVCTLREAILAAVNLTPRHSAPGECAAGSAEADSISFSGNYTITVGSQLPFINTSITITGNGAANTIIQAAASPNVATWRIFQVTYTGSLTLDGVTVRNGRCNGACTAVGNAPPNIGGGIYSFGTLTVRNSIISGNTAEAGGGIASSGSLTVINSTISGNSAPNSGSEGGGINHIVGPVNITNSTLSGNMANGDGGAMWSLSASVVIINSTISGNTASGSGGAIYNLHLDSLTMTNSTVSGNTAGTVGGISTLGIAILNNVIVANNSGGNCAGTIVNGGYNLDSGSSCGWGSNIGSMSNTNPKLGPLANNGGPTQTMALLRGSPAIDKGNNSFCNGSAVNGVDQRGVTRPKGWSCDIGAYEYNGTFWDVPLNYWAWDFIERLYSAGITSGCASSPLSYCPEGVVTRAQMAVFLLRGIHGASYAPPGVGASTGFSDVPTTYWAAAWIKELEAEGITSGCGNGNFCPEQPITRAQISIFLLRSKHGASFTPPGVGAGTGFADVPPSYWAAAWIKQLVAEGITAGCGGGNYCPESAVTRAQMAVFLVRTFSLP